jgi:hypothetical protein
MKKERLKQFVVIFVAADPDPFNRVAYEMTNGAMMIADSN